MVLNRKWTGMTLWLLVALVAAAPLGVRAGDRETRERGREERERGDRERGDRERGERERGDMERGERERDERERRERAQEEREEARELDRLRAELSELRERAADVLTKARRKFLEEELPEAKELLGRMVQQAEAKGASLMQQLERFEFEVWLGHVADELLDLKADKHETYGKVKEAKRLEMRSMQLAHDYRSAADPKKKEAVRKELAEVLEKSFDAEQALREMEAKDIERELEAVMNHLEMRRKHRAAIIQRHLHEMLDGEDPFEW